MPILRSSGALRRAVETRFLPAMAQSPLELYCYVNLTYKSGKVLRVPWSVKLDVGVHLDSVALSGSSYRAAPTSPIGARGGINAFRWTDTRGSRARSCSSRRGT